MGIKLVSQMAVVKFETNKIVKFLAYIKHAITINYYCQKFFVLWFYFLFSQVAIRKISGDIIWIWIHRRKKIYKQWVEANWGKYLQENVAIFENI